MHASAGRRRLPAADGPRARGRLVVAGPGQPDRRAHGLQRRLRAAVRDRGAQLGRRGPARRRRRCGCGRSSSPTSDSEVALDDLAPGHPEGWSAYVAGVVWALREAGHDRARRWTCWSTAGCRWAAGCRRRTRWSARSRWPSTRLHRHRPRHRTTWPSSSLATENDFVGARTGMMDQLASLRGTAGHALFLDNRTLEVEQVPLDAGRGRAAAARAGHPGAPRARRRRVRRPAGRLRAGRRAARRRPRCAT